MFTKVERLISSRNLRPKRKEGFLKIISIFSFVGIMLGVAILIIVMSVMNGFKTDLTNKILGLNPHIVVQPNNFIIDNDYVKKLKQNFKEASISKTYSGEGIIIINDKAKGIIFKGVNIQEKKIKEFFENNIVSGDINKFKKNNIFIGTELAFNLDLREGFFEHNFKKLSIIYDTKNILFFSIKREKKFFKFLEKLNFLDNKSLTLF